MPFELQPILKGQLLELRPLRAEDFHALYAVAADPLIWEQHPHKDRYQEEVFREFFSEALESGGALVAIDAKDDQVIGSSRFHGYDEERSEIEIGWTFLARSHWGGSYNREMKQLMLRHAFRFVESVIFLVGTENLRSQRAVEKIGGVRVGTRGDGSGLDSFIYRITRSNFAQEVPEVDDKARRIAIFFYGLFMDDTLLREKGMRPQNRRVASVENFCLRIGARATLVPCAKAAVHGVLCSLTHTEVDALYGEASVSAYRPEAVSAHLADGSVIPALCFNLPVPPSTDERNPLYVSRLREVAARIGLPPDYVSSIQ